MVLLKPVPPQGRGLTPGEEGRRGAIPVAAAEAGAEGRRSRVEGRSGREKEVGGGAAPGPERGRADR